MGAKWVRLVSTFEVGMQGIGRREHEEYSRTCDEACENTLSSSLHADREDIDQAGAKH